MPVKKLKEYLDKENVKYISIMHSPAFTAPEVAASAHISGKEMAKAVIIKMDDKMAMVVLPSHLQINFDALKSSLGTDNIELANEDEFKGQFPQCEVGAMPPFGNLYDMEVYLADELSSCSHITFNAGSHSELMQVDYEDYIRLVNPKVVNLSE